MKIIKTYKSTFFYYMRGYFKENEKTASYDKIS